MKTDPGPQASVVAGADHDLCLFALVVGGVDPVAAGAGSVRRVLKLIAALGAVPRGLVWDGEGAIGRWRAGRAELTSECQAFRGVLAAKVIICRPADPEAKGLIERSHDYLERSFLPGRTFASPADFNAQLADWLALVNTRPRRALGCASCGRAQFACGRSHCGRDGLDRWARGSAPW